MKISALLTSAGINVALCVVLLSLYSILRKQPSNFCVYFARRLIQTGPIPDDPNIFYRFVPTPSWLLRAWQATEEEIMEIAGVDAAVFLRLIVFSLRIFSVAALASFFLVLPFNYHGQEKKHKNIPSESLEVFTIANVKEGSRWLWGHCLAIYIITISACILLYFEYKSINRIRLTHLRTSPPKPSHFTVVVRSIPRYHTQSYSESVKMFFSKYHGSSYLGHQMVYRCGKVQKLMKDAESICRTAQSCTPHLMPCGICRGSPIAFRILSKEHSSTNRIVRAQNDLVLASEIGELPPYRDLATSARGEEVATAFVFFRTRYAASTIAEALQSSNPMIWVTDLAPEPQDVYWSNLCIPYRQLWIRRLASHTVAAVLMFVFILPVTFVQGLTQLDKLQKNFPFLRGLLKKKYMSLITGYLPSVILMLFLYAIPPIMMLLSTIEGYASRSGRKKSATRKILTFMIWNVFFGNVLSGSVISQLNVFNSPREIPTLLARAVPAQASFFTTYVLTSGWASLSSELMQPFALIWNVVQRYIFRKKDDSVAAAATYALNFPYHTEVTRVLLFGFLGFNFAILAPLILPFLLGYFFYAFLVYRNQFLNVYVARYDCGGQLWVTAHNTTIVSLVMTQIISIGVFGLKDSPVASGFTIPLIIGTILFSEHCRKRFHPVFRNNAAEILIELDQHDEQSGRLEEIHDKLKSVYCQYKLTSHKLCKSSHCGCKSGNHFPHRSSNFNQKEECSEDPVDTQQENDDLKEQPEIQPELQLVLLPQPQMQRQQEQQPLEQEPNS